MTASNLDHLRAQLTDRDHAVLCDVERFRLLSTKQIQRLHFDAVHPTPLAAARACTRALSRLHDLGILRHLSRRIGGVRAGSAGYVWYIGPVGDRLLKALTPRTRPGRRNYREPSLHFVAHTLAIAEVAVQVREAERRDTVEVLTLQTEPASWQPSLSEHGILQTLKPDLQLALALGDDEHHWFIEIDRATEHLPVIVRQCQAYQLFFATGRYQATHDVFPCIVWVAPDRRRQTQLAHRIATDPKIDDRLFTVITTAEVGLTLHLEERDINQLGGQEGGISS
ncbi:replication-relaxation family protein [Tsukamurella tyrosinosolvens]|uniref:replication-relaxation family protein n=1 Tax=Tsukamurella tyrosinosolvens TaxID=57704 RepID=UPI001CE10E13|nr:replication-relaxation family protein [Tsukamurella tyrosinosolvens]MCA4996799.1 replication-relaxation family protein [Tsukamurella tyrosinosolvens]